MARRFDVVVSNQSKGHVYGGVAAALARRPSLWWQQGTPERSRIEMVAARVPVAIVVASSTASVTAQRLLTPKHRVELVALGTDVAGLRRRLGSGASLRDKHGWGRSPLVGIVGRLQEWKGQEIFLRAAAVIARDHPDATFLLIGGALLGWEGDYPARLEQLAQELGLGKQVRFTGHQDDVYPWFDALDVVVHASFGEPFGLVLVEAMALNKPLIATRSGGPVDIIEDGTSGLLVPVGDHEAMAQAIVALLSDPERRATMGKAAGERAECFDERATAARFAELLKEVVA
ncbi:MAG: glycosyltransferase family 4 protein [Thermoleophilaceae bacterium]|nr:glycosyltransferase family 4 protein [Thermoleophilaceae bacterium]